LRGCCCRDVKEERSCFKKKLNQFKERIAQDEIAQHDALLRFYYPRIDIDKISDTMYCKLIAEVFHVLKYTGVLQEKKE